ncbi:MAG: hypothetical protein K9H64_00985 [Bacteroidales bacterium]|nr:hypothetical protein [Bacteroidales bacterium]MCF8454773.1 hypothetical protein [Bacteroidales bacterium]
MKNLLKGISLLLLVLISTTIIAQGPDNFMGIITYKMTVEGDFSEAEKAQSEGTLTMTYGDGVYKSRIEGMMGSMTFIVFNDSALMIQESMGQSMAIRMTTEEFEKVKDKMKQSTDSVKPDPVVQLIEETKVVAGLKCKKAEVEFGGEIIEVYYYDGYVLPENMREDEFKKIKGLPLEYSTPIGDSGSVIYTATEVKKKKKVKAKEFEVPAGIKTMTIEQLKAMRG